MLKKPSYCECLLLKTPLTVVKKKPTTAIFFFSLFALVYCAMFFIVIPRIDNSNYYCIAISSGFFLLFVVWLMASCKDPGYLK